MGGTSLDFLLLNMLFPDGACQSFDVSANGHCCSEGAVAIFLKKRIERIYSHVVNSKSSLNGHKKQGEGVLFPIFFSLPSSC